MAHGDCVDDYIEAQLVKHPNLTYLEELSEVKVLVSTDNSSDTVSVVSSGSRGGYDSARFVADGKLSACVYGPGFAAPPTQSIIAAIEAVTGQDGCLVVTKSQHLQNFESAAEQCKATNDFEIEILNAPKLAESIEAAAAAAVKGLPLAKVKYEANKVGNQLTKVEAREAWALSKNKKCSICGIGSKREYKSAYKYNKHWDSEHKTTRV